MVFSLSKMCNSRARADCRRSSVRRRSVQSMCFVLDCRLPLDLPGCFGWHFKSFLAHPSVCFHSSSPRLHVHLFEMVYATAGGGKKEMAQCVSITQKSCSIQYSITNICILDMMYAGGLSAADEDFERDHDRTLAEGLLAQVGEMKELAIDIGSEVRSHNRFLEGMEEGATTLLLLESPFLHRTA